MNKVLKFCKNCIDKPENEYYTFSAGELLWEGEMKGHSAFHCSKCEKEFEVGEKMFILKSELIDN
jgi:hypothetical protein